MKYGTVGKLADYQVIQGVIVPAKFRGAVLHCEDCGETFSVPPVRAKTARYCSRKCADKHRGHRQESKRVTLACLHCSQPYEAQACHAHRRKYCSRVCANKSLSNATFGHRRSAAWKKSDGLSMHSSGHVQVWSPDHPLATNGYVMQHRLVMERWLRAKDPASQFLIPLGRQLYLSPDYDVHHKDEVKTNNQISNLECLTQADHTRVHAQRRADAR